MTKVTNEEIVAVADGSADGLTERRVLAAALRDPAVRRRLTLLREVEQETAPLPVLSPAVVAQQQESLRILARRVGREYQEKRSAPTEPALDWRARLGERVRKVLTFPAQPLHLPALTPALAASESPLQVLRVSVTLQEIQLEVHQLPTEPPQLRFYADASASAEFIAGETSGVAIALQERGASDFWIEVIPLNEQGRGALELAAPLVEGSVELLAAALVTG